MAELTCSKCGRSDVQFSTSQLKKGADRRCKTCIAGGGRKQSRKKLHEQGGPDLPPHLTRVSSPFLSPMLIAVPLSDAAEECARQQIELERIISGVDALVANQADAREVGHLVDLIASGLPPPDIDDECNEWEDATERARLCSPLEWAQNPNGGRDDFEFRPSHQLQAGSPRFFEDVAGTLVLATWDLDHIKRWDVDRLLSLGGATAEVASAAPQLLMGGQQQVHLQPGSPRERFLAHSAATALGLTSSSDGTGDTKHVVLHGPEEPCVLPITQPTKVSSIAAGRDAVLLLRELLTQLQVDQCCIYFGGSREIPASKMDLIDAWRQALPQKMRKLWEQRCNAQLSL